ncbi:hypothetical protein B0H19DRAFT_1378597 [Mycena capillaripes]|nr:hypothetical protein B0H19DRAFT_1378597 [Mycena capillaripes]
MDGNTDNTPVESRAQVDLDVVGRSCNAAVINTSSRDINMINCTTTSNFTLTSAPAIPSDFRRFPLGDIDLRHEIRLHDKTELISSWDSIDLDNNLDPIRIEENHVLRASLTDSMIIKALPLMVYHDICSINLNHHRLVSIPTHTSVQPGSVIRCSPSSQHPDCIEIASLPEFVGIFPWNDSDEFKEDEWTRDVFNTTIKLRAYVEQKSETWLTQANNIFGRLGITSNRKDYVLVSNMLFTLEIPQTTEDPPAGFLFICPSEDFRTGPESVGWPDCPAYWSLDPSGVDRLSTEDATRLGFPVVQQTVEAEGLSWDDSVYNGLRQFHCGKGFDPDSQDVALHLLEELFELSSEINPPFAHASEEDTDREQDSDSAYTDYEREDTRLSTDEDEGKFYFLRIIEA